MMINLNELWLKGIDDRPAVIGKNGETWSRLALFNAAYELSKLIDGQKVAIFCNSTKMQTIAFLAAIRSSSSLIFPSTNQAEALKEIQEEFDVLLTDDFVPAGIHQIQVPEIDGHGHEDLSLAANPVDLNFKISFFTSGTTGKPKEINKYLFQLSNEIQIWEEMYGTEIGLAEVHSTVSHQHIYGLIFRMLWPLCAGRPFCDLTASRWEEISEDTKDGRPFILASSPTHLSRLTPLEDEDVSVQPLITFSSGGVIQNEFAAKAAGLLGRPILEIYGSTETGGVAKRHNAGADEIWIPLPSVDVSENEKGCLQVRSDFLPDKQEAFHTEDLVTFVENGSFILNGRADRIVKIEGKRVSLPRIEGLLRRHEWVRDVFVKVLEGERRVIGAVVELNEQGTSFLTKHEKFRTGRRLREYLAQFEDAVTAPRRWRFVEYLPRTPQGKIRAADIDTLFEKGPVVGGLDRQVFTKTSFTEISTDISEDAAVIRLNLPADLDFFRGHFTDTPLLPGIVQVHWAVQKSRDIFGFSGQPQKIEKLKFKQFLFPGSDVTLTLKQASDCKVTFSYESETAKGEKIEHSSGTLNFGRPS